MDFALRPWRTAALVASAVAALELVLLVALAVVVLGKPVAEQLRQEATEQAFAPVASKPKAKAKPAVTAPKLARGETSVLVLNGNGRPGAAQEAGNRVQGLGYVVGGVGNAPRTDYRRTLVMYRPGLEAEARRLAKDLGGAVVGPLDGLRPTELMGAHLAVILGP